jgi:hypothetical protein
MADCDFLAGALFDERALARACNSHYCDPHVINAFFILVTCSWSIGVVDPIPLDKAIGSIGMGDLILLNKPLI